MSDLPNLDDLEALRDDITDRDPHSDGCVEFKLPGYAVHLEVCGGEVNITVSRKTAGEMLEALQQRLTDPLEELDLSELPN